MAHNNTIVFLSLRFKPTKLQVTSPTTSCCNLYHLPPSRDRFYFHPVCLSRSLSLSLSLSVSLSLFLSLTLFSISLLLSLFFSSYTLFCCTCVFLSVLDTSLSPCGALCIVYVPVSLLYLSFFSRSLYLCLIL